MSAFFEPMFHCGRRDVLDNGVPAVTPPERGHLRIGGPLLQAEHRVLSAGHNLMQHQVAEVAPVENDQISLLQFRQMLRHTAAFIVVGYRRIRAALSRQQVLISEKVVRRLMRQEGLCAATTKRRRYGSYRGEISPAPANLINRDFRAAGPNQKWLTDISEFQIPAGKVYLSPVIDCFDGLVVSWSIGTRPDAELVNAMLGGAIETVAESADRPVVHSDRGAHYRWPGWLSRMRDARLIRSMSRKGYSPDNAACEGFFGRLKTEMFYSRDWRGATVDQFIETLDAYIRWYNAKRIKVSLGSLSPLEYRGKSRNRRINQSKINAEPTFRANQYPAGFYSKPASE